MCFMAIGPQNKNIAKLLEKIYYFPHEGGGYPSMENSMEIINARLSYYNVTTRLADLVGLCWLK